MSKSKGTTPPQAPDDAQQVEPKGQLVEPKKKKVAIVGFAQSTLEQAPVNDDTWEIWGLNRLWQVLPRWDVWFDIHPMSYIRTDQQYLSWLMEQRDKPILMQAHTPTIPCSVPYPKEEIKQFFGTYFTSSIAWMLALAIAQKYPVIGLWGVDMLGDGEYEYQRACVDYYVGFARGAGIEVVIPQDSACARGQDLYGYDHVEPFKTRRITRLKKREKVLTVQRDKVLRDLMMIDGAMNEVAEWTQVEHDDDWKAKRAEFLRNQREEMVKAHYTIDGALQELNGNMQYERHYKRGGA